MMVFLACGPHSLICVGECVRVCVCVYLTSLSLVFLLSSPNSSTASFLALSLSLNLSVKVAFFLREIVLKLSNLGKCARATFIGKVRQFWVRDPLRRPSLNLGASLRISYLSSVSSSLLVSLRLRAIWRLRSLRASISLSFSDSFPGGDLSKI